MKKSEIDIKVKKVTEYAIAFFHTHNRNLANKRKCYQTMSKIADLSKKDCLYIEFLVLKFYHINKIKTIMGDATIFNRIIDLASEKINQHIGDNGNSSVQELKTCRTAVASSNRAVANFVTYMEEMDRKNATPYALKDLRVITLSNDGLNQDDIKIISHKLSKYIMHLDFCDLHNNPFGDLGLEHLFNGFLNTPSYRNVNKLNLSNTHLTDKAVQNISCFLIIGNLPALKYLDLSKNQLSQAGQKTLVIAVNSSVNPELSIVLENYTSKSGVAAFCKKSFAYYA